MIMCILSVVPLMIAAGLELADIWMVYSVCVLLAFVSLGVFVLVQSGNIWESYQRLLQEGDYSIENKRSRRKMAPLVGAYWCLVTAVYLAVNFRSNNWERTWPIWPVAALLFVVLLGIYQAVIQHRDTR